MVMNEILETALSHLASKLEIKRTLLANQSERAWTFDSGLSNIFTFKSEISVLMGMPEYVVSLTFSWCLII